MDETLVPRQTGDTLGAPAVEALAGQAAEAERLGRLPDATVALLLDLGMARSLVPRCWGGLELPVAAVLDAVATLAHGCMSAAWCAALYAEHPWVLAHFPEQAQADVWSGGPDVPISMSIAAEGEATPVVGGFTLTGAWPFVSGCDHARWLLFLARWPADDGAPPGGGLFLVPRAEVSIDHASWQVAGLRGTGSKTVRVQGAFVPAHRVQDAATNGPGRPRAARAASALYCQPVGGTLGLALAAVALGGAEGAFELFRQRMKQRVLRLRGEVQAADPAAQIELAATAVRVASARLLLHAACDQVRQAGEADGEPSAEALAELRVYKAHVVALCAEAINRLFASSGGGALQDANPLQRLWRDVHAVQAHASLTWSTQAQNYGSIAVGLGPTLRAWWQGSPAGSSG